MASQQQKLKITLLMVPNGKSTPQHYLTACDICSGLSMSSKATPSRLAPLRLAPCKSQPLKLQFSRSAPANTAPFVGFFLAIYTIF